MKTIKKFKLFISSLLVFTLLVSCVSDDSIVTDPIPISDLTITQVIASSPNLSIFLEAMLRTNLDGTFNSSGTYTIFAPNDDAFNDYFDEVGVTGLASFSNDQLADLVLNHVLETEITTANLSSGYTNTLSVGPETNEISLLINNSGDLNLNNTVSLFDNVFDINTSNGYIHVVDNVINIPTVYNHLEINPDFSTFVEALSRTSLSTNFDETLNGSTDSPFTVFAPTNAAFEALLSDLGLSSLDEIGDDTLESILAHHISSDNNFVLNSFTDAQIISTLSEADLEIDFNDGIKIIDGSGLSTSIILNNIQSTNGIIHSIDRVLLPETL